MKIAFFDAKPYDIKQFDLLAPEYGCNIKYFESHLNPDTAALAAGCETVCVFVNDTVNAEVIDILHKNGTRLIALRCAGYNNVDFKHAFNKINVVRVPAYSPHAIAEHTLALIMALNRKTHRAFNRTREANFSLNGLMGFDLYGKTAGVVGTGKIGRCLIDILHGLGMEVLAHDLHPDASLEEKGLCRFVTLDELVTSSDVISLNCPLTKETEYLVNAERIGAMKPGVMIINTGRGKLINTRDLVEGLKSGQVGYAGLDVYEEESQYFFEDKSDMILDDDILARLLSFNNVIITSHQAFFTKEAVEQIARTTFNNIMEFHAGKPLTNEICYRCHQFPGQCSKKKDGYCFRK